MNFEDMDIAAEMRQITAEVKQGYYAALLILLGCIALLIMVITLA